MRHPEENRVRDGDDPLDVPGKILLEHSLPFRSHGALDSIRTFADVPLPYGHRRGGVWIWIS